MEIARQQPPQEALPQHPPPPSTLCPASKLSQLKESLKLEHQLLRVPFEHYKKTIRANHRAVEKEISSVISGVTDVTASTNLPKDDAVSHLSSLISHLQGLKRQEFIELVRTENNTRAISYARKYLAPWGATHMEELQRVMATLAFESNIDCAKYKLKLHCLPTLRPTYYYENDCTKEDPLSQESFRKLASHLPYSKQRH